jgi:rod shape-determining protein MreC
MRELLGAAPMRPLRAQMVPLAAVDLDPYRQRLLLAAGSEQGLRVGQVLVDSGGVLGQLVDVAPNSAQALLVTDPAHAIPVTFMRSGLRSIAFGTGQADALELPNLPRSADVRVGDLVVTSGIGGRFPPGFPVGRVVDIGPDETRLFLVARLRPAAHVERGEEVLVVDEAPLLVAPAAAPVATPPANVPAPTEGAATVAPPAAAPATTSAESAETAEQAAYELPEGTRR